MFGGVDLLSGLVNVTVTIHFTRRITISVMWSAHCCNQDGDRTRLATLQLFRGRFLLKSEMLQFPISTGLCSKWRHLCSLGRLDSVVIFVDFYQRRLNTEQIGAVNFIVACLLLNILSPVSVGCNDNTLTQSSQSSHLYFYMDDRRQTDSTDWDTDTSWTGSLEGKTKQWTQDRDTSGVMADVWYQISPQKNLDSPTQALSSGMA